MSHNSTTCMQFAVETILTPLDRSQLPSIQIKSYVYCSDSNISGLFYSRQDFTRPLAITEFPENCITFEGSVFAGRELYTEYHTDEYGASDLGQMTRCSRVVMHWSFHQTNNNASPEHERGIPSCSVLDLHWLNNMNKWLSILSTKTLAANPVQPQKHT